LIRPVSADRAIVQHLEEVVALIVDQDEGGEVFHLDFPDCFHAEFRVLEQFNLPDVVLGEQGGGTAD
jgi:hypothetical protein